MPGAGRDFVGRHTKIEGWDWDSVMNYCSQVRNGDSRLSYADIIGVRRSTDRRAAKAAAALVSRIASSLREPGGRQRRIRLGQLLV